MPAENGFGRSSLALLVLTLTACAAEPAPAVFEAPLQPLFVALVALEDGVPSSGSGLVRWEPSEGLPLFADGEKDHLIIGLSEADLEALAPLDEEQLANTPVRRADRCEPPLPAPTWAARWSAGTSAPESWDPAIELPVLTASWLSDRCEDIDASRWMVETSCNDFGVFATVVPTEQPCTRDLTLVNYMLPTLRARLWYDGGICVQTAEPTPECQQDAKVESALDCTGDEPCRLEVGLADHSMPPFTSETVKLLPDVEPYSDARYEGSREYRASRTEYGWGRGMAVLDDQVWVSVLETLTTECPSRALGEIPAELIELSKANLAQVRTTTAPPCLGRLLPDGASQFLGAFVLNDLNRIGRFDENGRLVESRILGDGPNDLAASVPFYQVVALERARSGEVLVLLSDVYKVDMKQESKLLVLDPNTLAIRRRLDSFGPGIAYALLELDGGRAAIGFESTNAVQYIDLAGPSLEQRFPFEHDPGVGTHGLASSASTLYYAAYSLLFGFDTRTGRELWREPVSARPMSLIRVEPWPADPNLLMVLGLSAKQAPPFVTLATFFDLREERFRPGVYEIGGMGTPSYVRPDGEGGFIVLQPWGPELTRITPKNP